MVYKAWGGGSFRFVLDGSVFNRNDLGFGWYEHTIQLVRGFKEFQIANYMELRFVCSHFEWRHSVQSATISNSSDCQSVGTWGFTTKRSIRFDELGEQTAKSVDSNMQNFQVLFLSPTWSRLYLWCWFSCITSSNKPRIKIAFFCKGGYIDKRVSGHWRTSYCHSCEAVWQCFQNLKKEMICYKSEQLHWPALEMKLLLLLIPICVSAFPMQNGAVEQLENTADGILEVNNREGVADLLFEGDIILTGWVYILPITKLILKQETVGKCEKWRPKRKTPSLRICR